MVRISLNSLWMLLARVAGQGTAFLLAVLIARHLGEANLGRYALITGVAFVGNVLTTFGMDTLLIRHIARERETAGAPLAVALTLQLGLACVYILGVWLLADRLTRQSPVTALALRILLLSLLPLAFSTVFSAALRAYERMELYLGVVGVTGLLQVTGAFLLLRRGGGLVALTVLLVGAQALSALLAGGACWVFLPRFRLSWRLVTPAALARTARLGLSLALLAVLAVLYQRLGVFLLAGLGDEAQMGWFSAAARPVEGLKMLPYAFFGAIFPIMARQQGRGQEGRWYAWSGWGLLAFALLGALLLQGLSRPLVRWLYGPGYGPAATALGILAWGLLPFVLTLKLSFELVAAGRERRALVAMAATLILAAFFGVVGYHTAGFVGLCWAVVAGESVQAALLYTLRP